MAEITIGENHRELVSRWQHVLEWLQGEQSRLESERFLIMKKGAEVQQEMLLWLSNAYGVPLNGVGVTVDAARGVITAPDEEKPAEPAESAPAPPDE